MKKILVVRYRFIGDTLLTIPFLRNLRYANPDAQIDMIVAPGSGEILKNCPYVNQWGQFRRLYLMRLRTGIGQTL